MCNENITNFNVIHNNFIIYLLKSVHQNTELVFKCKNFKTGDGFPRDSSLCSALGNKYADDYHDVTKKEILNKREF